MFIILLTWRGWLNSEFKKRIHCHSFMALNRASDVSAADWLSQHTWKINDFSKCGDTVFLSDGGPIKHSSLHNKNQHHLQRDLCSLSRAVLPSFKNNGITTGAVRGYCRSGTRVSERVGICWQAALWLAVIAVSSNDPTWLTCSCSCQTLYQKWSINMLWKPNTKVRNHPPTNKLF